jgi:hypothetical protein
LDHGTLKLPDGRVFTGDFTIAHKERSKYTYFEMVQGAQLPFTKEPLLFYGSISYGQQMPSMDMGGLDYSATPMNAP